jgi:hypothetical protein
MKKLKFWIFCCIICFYTSTAFCAGTVAITSSVKTGVGVYGGIKTVTCTCVGDAANGSIPNTAFSSTLIATLEKSDYCLFKVRTIAGSTSPTDDSDVYLWMNLASGTVDLLGGAGVNALDSLGTAAHGQEFLPLVGASTVLQPVTDGLTLQVSNQVVHSARYTIEFIFVAKPK